MKTTFYLAAICVAVLAGVAPDADAAPILLVWACCAPCRRAGRKPVSQARA